ncbi:MAG: hypothetical protein LR008_01855 [Candidatus Pacebacteria bacterium]|nr:hypothetical protein [Candidatus Paceibacterota bacterium]
MTFSQTPKTLLTFVYATFLCLSFSAVAHADTVVRSGETVSVAEENIIEGDFYAGANIVNISGSVDEDLVSAAAQITINGSVGDDALIVSGKTNIHGTVGDDLRIISGEVTIAESIEGDLFVIGGVVNILSTARIGGDILVYAGQVTVEGEVEGDVIGSVEQLRLDAPIGGDVDVMVTQLTIGDRAVIEGDVRYVSELPANQSLNATLKGELVRSDPVLPGSDLNAKTALVPVLVLLFSVLVWFLVSRKTLSLLVNRALVHSPRPFLIGLISVFMVPVAAGLLLVSMIGTLVGVVAMLAYALFLALSVIGLSAVLGQLMMKVFNQPAVTLSLVTLAVGVVGVSLLLLLPFVGQAILLALGVLTFGTIIDLLIRPSLN